jgi:hypothetical protein
MKFTLHSFVRSVALGLLAALATPAALYSADDVTVSSTTYSGTQTVQADNSVTTSGSVVVNNGANITFQAGGRTTLAPGFKVNAGGLFRIETGAALAFTTGFESGDGYSVATINSQKGWNLLQGTANVSTAEAFAGSRSLSLLSGSTAAAAQHAFLISGTPSITFLDLYAKPVAASTAVASSVVQTESAQIGFQIASGQGEVYVFDGVGANQWLATGVRFALNGSNQATSWIRLTLRADYTGKKWDAYVNGVLVDYDLAFASNSETYLRVLTLLGITSATAYFDGVAVQATNPLFTDADKDGMADSWETANSLNTGADDRNSNYDGDSKTNIEEYFLGTLANNADVTAPSAPAVFYIVHTAPTALGISWLGASDTGAGTPGISGYHVYRNGVKVNSSLITGSSYVDTGLSASTTYTYTVRTVDLAGNLSAASSGLAVATPASSSSGSFHVFTPL